MAYRVKTSKGYWEERESYRDPVTGKPRSRFLRYLGKIGEIDWAAAFQSTPEDRAIAAAERAMERAEENAGPVVKEISRLPDGLHVGPTEPAPIDKVPAAESAEASFDDAGEKEQAPDEGPVEPS